LLGVLFQRAHDLDVFRTVRGIVRSGKKRLPRRVLPTSYPIEFIESESGGEQVVSSKNG
jgi:hypothetical protein